MKRSCEEFQEAAKKKQITKWTIHYCSICGYPCGFLFENDYVGYDNGCDCSRYCSHPRWSSWDEVVDHYNLQTNDKVLKAYDDFWGFNTDEVVQV